MGATTVLTEASSVAASRQAPTGFEWAINVTALPVRSIFACEGKEMMLAG